MSQFLKDNFRTYSEQDIISIYDFIEKGVLYQIGGRAKDDEIYKMKDLIRNDLTTTNPDVLSLNALEILTKKMTLKHYIISNYIEAKVNLREEEIEGKKKKLLSGVTERIDNLTYKEQELDHFEKEILKREHELGTKEKSIVLRQRELLQREK